MIVVASSDWHLDAVTAGQPRFDDVTKAVETTIEAALDEHAALYLFLGDLCDPGTSRSHRAVAFAVATALKLARYKVRNVWIPGNHDVVEDGYGTSTLSPLAALPGVIVANEPGLVRVPDLDLEIVALPFTPRSHTYDPEAVVREFATKAKPALVIGHLMLEGIAPGSETLDMPRGRDVVFPLAECCARLPGVPMANGHYHNGGAFVGSNILAPVHIPGSLARLTFGERSNDPGFLIMEVGNG